MASNILLAKQSPTFTSNGDTVNTMVEHCKGIPYNESYNRKKYAYSGKTAISKDKLFLKYSWANELYL